MASLKADNDRLQRVSSGRSPATSPASSDSAASLDNMLSLGDPSSLGTAV